MQRRLPARDRRHKRRLGSSSTSRLLAGRSSAVNAEASPIPRAAPLERSRAVSPERSLRCTPRWPVCACFNE